MKEKQVIKEFTSMDSLITAINKKFGKTVVARARDVKSIIIRKLKTGIFAIDCELGGGFPMGRVTHITGAYSSGKTTIANYIAKQVMKKPEKNEVVYVDLEGTWDKHWAKCIGVDVDRLIFCQPEKSMQGLDVAIESVKTGKCGMVVIDSFASMSAEAELITSIDAEARMGVNAQKGNKFIRQIVSAVLKQDMMSEKGLNDCIILILNQQRATMDKYHPFVSPGGMGKDFASSVMLELRRGDLIAEKTEGVTKKDIVGHEVHFKVAKSKVSTPFKVGCYDLYNADSPVFGMSKGSIDNDKSVLLYAVDKGIIKRGGAIYKYDGKKFKGMERVIKYFKHRPDKFKELESRLLNPERKVKRLLKRGGK